MFGIFFIKTIGDAIDLQTFIKQFLDLVGFTGIYMDLLDLLGLLDLRGLDIRQLLYLMTSQLGFKALKYLRHYNNLKTNISCIL